MPEKTAYLIRAQETVEKEGNFPHPWNPNSLVKMVSFSQLTGLKRTDVSLAKIPPGKESFIYHSHYREEEWNYILSGKGIAEIDREQYEVEQGDFMGFPTPGVAHHLRNPYEDELMYLVGGENVEVEIADFPNLKRRMIRYPDKVETFDWSDDKGFGFLEE